MLLCACATHTDKRQPPAADLHCSNALKIHSLAVGSGQSTLISGPNGTNVLIDFPNSESNNGLGTALQELGFPGGSSFKYGFVSHNHVQKYGGLQALLGQGFSIEQVVVNGSPFKPDSFPNDIQTSPAEVGNKIDLGCGAEIVIAASNGALVDQQVADSISRQQLATEHDRSIAFLVRQSFPQSQFSMLINGDLGITSGSCEQQDVPVNGLQIELMHKLIRAGLLSDREGVDVLQINQSACQTPVIGPDVNFALAETAIVSAKPPLTSPTGTSQADSVAQYPERIYRLHRGTTDAGYSRISVRDDQTYCIDSSLGGIEDLDCYTFDEFTDSSKQLKNVAAMRSNADSEHQSDQHTAKEPVHQGRQATEAEQTNAISAERITDLAPFFDQVEGPYFSGADLTPALPASNAFDHAVLALCGTFPQPIKKSARRLEQLLRDFPEVSSFLQSNLRSRGVRFSDSPMFETELATIWTRTHGFQHIMCGEVGENDKLGGLHFAPRYEELHKAGIIGMWTDNMAKAEAIDGLLYTIPVIANCPNKLCKSSRKGYRLDWDAADLLLHGAIGWAAFKPDSYKSACRYEDELGISGVFVIRDDAILTQYSTVTPNTKLPDCFPGGKHPSINTTWDNRFETHGDSCH